MTDPAGAGSGPGWVVAAYSASPSRFGWDPAAEAEYLEGVLALPGLVGLEIPYVTSLDKYDEAWLLAHLPHHLDVVVTMIPATTAGVKADPVFGLASDDAAGRRAALDVAAGAARAVHRLHDVFGRQAVRAVEVHSAPRSGEGRSSAASLTASLVELTSWDWGGAQVVVEHCDAPAPGRSPAKGYLPLRDEIDAVLAANQAAAGGADRPPVGLLVNWARSVIEGRDAHTAVEHTAAAAAAGLLTGVVFAGCAPVDTRFGAAWGDVHVPPAPDGLDSAHSTATRELLEPQSLLTTTAVTETVRAAGALWQGFYGLKVAPLRDASIAERVSTLRQSLMVLDRGFAPASAATPS